MRWTLEEVGQPYDVRLLSFKAMKEAAHLALHPFGQIPTFEDEAAGDIPVLAHTVVLSKRENPWDLAFLPDGTIFFTETCKGSRQ